MNKSLVALAVCGIFSAAAQAQTSVSIYGVADAGVSNDNGRFAAGTTNAVGSGLQTGSRIGFKGSEDLGGGLSAIFNLENGYNIDDGSLAQGANLLFGRKAFVGLQGGFGAVKLGRQDSAVYTSTFIYDPFTDGIAGAYTRVFTNNSALRRNDNTIDYTTPTLGGFNAEAAYSFGEVAGDNSAGRGFSGSIGYAAGPLSVTLSHQNVNSRPVAPAAIVSTKLTALGGSYDFQVVKVSALYQTNKADTAPALDTRDALIGMSVPFGASTFLASYIRHTDKAVGASDANQIAIGYTYALSKRTNLYTGYSRIANDGNARFGLATVATGGSASGTTDKLFVAGVRHLF